MHSQRLVSTQALLIFRQPTVILPNPAEPYLYGGLAGNGAKPVCARPPDPDGLFSEGAEVIKLHKEGSLTIPTTWIKMGKPMGILKVAPSSTAAGPRG